MNVSYEYYRIFYYAAKCRSLTKAAQILGSNQPNVTRCINKLEQEMGCKLLVRSRRGVTLTPEGRRLYGHVAVACEQLQAAEEELSAGRRLEAGSVAVGISETALHVMLLQKLRQFHALYPNIRLRITNHSTPQAMAALHRGGVDLAVVTTPSGAVEPCREFPLTSFRDILVGGPQFAALAEQELPLKKLSDYPLIFLTRETMTYRFYEHLFFTYGLPLRPDMEAAATTQILALVKNDLGLAFLPEALAAEALEREEVFRIPLREQIPERQVCLVKDTSRTLSIAAEAFEQLLYTENGRG